MKIEDATSGVINYSEPSSVYKFILTFASSNTCYKFVSFNAPMNCYEAMTSMLNKLARTENRKHQNAFNFVMRTIEMRLVKAFTD